MSNNSFHVNVLFLIVYWWSFQVFANEIQTVLMKSDSAEWTVTYRVSSPVSKLVFKITPDNSRAARWKPLSDKFTIKHEEGNEYIARQDGDTFTEVSFTLTPTYTPLPKQYAPFSPFSDGGMLVHSGRFFTCIDSCHAEQSKWEMSVVAPGEDNIIVNGKIYRNKAVWQDNNSGTKIYVGPATPVEETYFISVIDKKLPAEIKQAMSAELPKLMQFFARKLGSLGARPALFASFSESTDGGFGRQGGTLPGQVFMHWYGEEAIERVNSKSIYWFFAHEVAHIYQREAGDVKKAQDAWVQEGSADMFAGLASEKNFFETQLAGAKKACITALEKSSSYTQASTADVNVHYTCGLVIMNAINNEITNRSQKDDLFTLWNLFNQQVVAGKAASAQTFIDTAKPYLSSELTKVLESISTRADYNPIEFFRQLDMEQPGKSYNGSERENVKLFKNQND